MIVPWMHKVSGVFNSVRVRSQFPRFGGAYLLGFVMQVMVHGGHRTHMFMTGAIIWPDRTSLTRTPVRLMGVGPVVTDTS